jgi:hypothetical protein
VYRERFDELDPALEALERHAKDIRSAGPLQGRKLIREFEPADLVAGRVEISTGGMFGGGITAGIDVMGDGRYVAFTGGVGRDHLDFGDRSPFTEVRRALGAG